MLNNISLSVVQTMQPTACGQNVVFTTQHPKCNPLQLTIFIPNNSRLVPYIYQPEGVWTPDMPIVMVDRGDALNLADYVLGGLESLLEPYRFCTCQAHALDEQMGWWLCLLKQRGFCDTHTVFSKNGAWYLVLEKTFRNGDKH